MGTGKTVTEHDGQPMFLDVTIVEPSFFQIFPLPFAQGSAATALPDLNSVVLTESEAIRQFGTADALGKVLVLGAGEGKQGRRVSGVLRDLPRNTSCASASSISATRSRPRPNIAAGAISSSSISSSSVPALAHRRSTPRCPNGKSG